MSPESDNIMEYLFYNEIMIYVKCEWICKFN
jgi:hypothetical protein